MIQLCVFDMDGLLIDSERRVYIKSGLETSRELGRPVSEEFLKQQMGGSSQIYFERLKKEYGQDYPTDEYVKRYFERVYHSFEHDVIPLRPGVKEMLDFCKASNIKMAIATTSHRKVVDWAMSKHGLLDDFDYVVSVEMVEHTKPDPEIFLKAVDHFGIPHENALVFEDAHNGAQAAINGGLRYIMVEDLAILTNEDRQKAVLVTDDISKAIDLIRTENERTAGI